MPLRKRPLGLAAVCAACVLMRAPAMLQAQEPNPPAEPAIAPPPATSVATRPAGFSPIPPELSGRPVEAVRVLGNRRVPTAVILNVVRTREGEKFDPLTVEEDYQRIFELKRFSNVEARVEPTETGVVVAFIVTEQRQIERIAFQGNRQVSTDELRQTVDLEAGQAIDPFRIALARQAIERLYREENFPYAHVEVPQEPLNTSGELVFNIVEGPQVRVRRVNFEGNRSFTADRLRDQIQTAYWIWIFRPGTFDPEQVEDDVAALRRYYESKGFFDARVGRRLTFSPDQSELQVTFVIDEGPRYTIDRVSFKGNTAVSEAELRISLNLVEGRPFDAEVLQRDIRQIVRAYSPYGYIYQPRSTDPDYLRIEPLTLFSRTPGRLKLVYQVTEGKPFRVGRILIKGNSKTQDKVILRELRLVPGQLYDSAEVQDAIDRLRGTPYFNSVRITPIKPQGPAGG